MYLNHLQPDENTDAAGLRGGGDGAGLRIFISSEVPSNVDAAGDNCKILLIVFFIPSLPLHATIRAITFMM